jgi:hypothetical protein
VSRRLVPLWVPVGRLGMLAAVPASSAPFAGRIDAGNVAVLRPGGLDGIGGIGDWALTNGALCAVVSDPGHESDLSTRGGMLVDLGRCGGNDDQWILLQPLVNFSQDGAIPIQTVRAKALPGAAWLTVGGEARGLSLEIRYELDLEHPERLRIATRVLRAASGERLYGLAHIVLHTEHGLRPFSLVTGDLAASRGFRHAAIDVESPFSVVRAAHVADLLVLVGAGRIEPGISYGRRLVRAERVGADGVRTELQSFTLAGEQFSGLAVFARPFWVGGSAGIGLLEIAQAFFMDLPEGDALTLEEEIWVGERSDTASVTDLLWPEAPLVRGSVDDEARSPWCSPSPAVASRFGCRSGSTRFEPWRREAARPGPRSPCQRPGPTRPSWSFPRLLVSSCRMQVPCGSCCAESMAPRIRCFERSCSTSAWAIPDRCRRWSPTTCTWAERAATRAAWCWRPVATACWPAGVPSSA